MTGEKTSSADNQQARKSVSDEYLSGFVDGEGCFYVGFSRREDLPLGWQIITEFHVSQNPRGKNVLELLRKRLGCGYLKLNHPKSSKDKTWVLVVKDRKALKERVIPFFEKHPLYSGKKEEVAIFKKVLQVVENKEHLKKAGFRKIVNLVFSLPRVTNKRYSQETLLQPQRLYVRSSHM